MASADDDALCVDGTTWLTRADLAAAVRAGAARSAAPDVGLSGGVAVVASDPLVTLTTLLAVRAAGAVPVVVGTDLDGAAVADLVRRADRLAGPVGPQLRRPHPEHEPLLVVQTSGTSSRPRAVVRTEASWSASLGPFGGVAGLDADDVVWAPGALSATLTLFAAWHALATGLPLLATGRWRGVAAAGPAVRRVTAVQCVPTVLADVLEAHAAGLLPALRTAVVAGAVLPDRLRERAVAGGVRLVEYYGAAELSFVAVDPDGSGLRPFPGAELAIRDGLVWVRSPYLALGYLGRSGAVDDGTEGTDGGMDGDTDGGMDGDTRGGRPLRRDVAGWATVGDRGRLGPDGRLVVAGRAGESVTVGGHSVLAEDVETALRDVPGVAEVACVGEPHARLGERVVLAVRAEPGADPVAALRDAARRALPPPARPVRYVVLADLPRTAGGTVARAALREVVTRAGRTAGRGGSPRSR